MNDFTRREFTHAALGSMLTYSLLDVISQSDAVAAEVKPNVDKWLLDVNQLSADIKGQKLKQIDWQKKVEELFAKVNLRELLKKLDFEKLTKDIKLVDNGARSLRFKLPEVEGLPKNVVFGKQIFALKKGRSVVPHGHNNMATAFLILKGNFHGRHYDRLEDQKDHILIRPTIDRKFGAATYSTVSDVKDNIHWFKAEDEPAFIFNIHVLNVQPGSKLPTGRVYMNPNGQKLKDGTVLAPRLGYKESHELFG